MAGTEVFPMKRAPKILLATLVFLTLAPGFIPPAAALTWTTVNIDTTASVGGSPFCMNAATEGDSVWVVHGAKDTQSIEVARSTDKGHTYQVTTIEDNANQLECPSIDVATSGTNTVLVTCWVDATSSDIYFSRSGNGGVLWSIPLNVAGTSANKNCAIAALSTTTYLIVYCDETATDVLSIRSTDSGGTWGSPVTVDSTGHCRSTGAQNDRAITIANKNATDAVAVWVTSSGTNAKGCGTNNAGTSWGTCYTVQSGTAQSVDLEYVDDNTYDLALLTTTPNIKWCRTDTGGQANGFGCATAAASPGTSTDVGIAVSTTEPDKISIVWGNGGTSQTQILKGTQSTNGGASWTSTEVIRTLTGGTNAQSGPVASIINSDGEILAFQAWCTSTCGSTTARVLEANYATFASPIGAADEEVTVTGLVGMTIDRSGRLLVARTDSGTFVRNYNAQDLSAGATGSYNTANCAGVTRPGIMAEFPNVGFLDCDSGANFNMLRIRSNTMQPPEDVPSDNDGACPTAAGDACAYDIGPSGSNGDYGQFSYLYEVNTFDQTFGLNYAKAHRAPDCATKRQYESTGGVLGSPYCGWENFWWWSFTSTTGKMGIHTLVTKDGAIGDRRHEYYVQFTPTSSTPNHLCTSSAVGPGTYIAAANSAVATQEYSVRFTLSEGDILNSDLTATLQQQWGGSGINYQAQGIACRGDVVLLFNPNFATQKIFAYSPTDGQFLYSIDLEGIGADRGITVASDRTFGAFVDGSYFRVFNTTSGQVTKSYALPSGTFKDIRMDRAAQNVWVGAGTKIARYLVYEATTITPAPILPDEAPGCDPIQFVCVTPTPAPTPSGGLFDQLGGDPGARIGSAIGVGEFGGNLLLACSTILGLTVTGATTLGALGRFRAVMLIALGAVIGFIGGFLMAWAFGFLTPGVVFTVVIISLLFVVGGFFLFRGG